MDEREAAQRCATASRLTVDAWHPAVHEWWAAGHDLAELVEWVERTGASPAYVSAVIPLANSHPETHG